MKPKFIMMVGLVASGKSYKADELAKEYDATVFSSDALRLELYGDINNQEHNHELFNELHRRIKECLKSGKSAIYDATNINYKRRMAFLAELKYVPCEKICVLMATPYEECLKRNAERERKVPEEVIKRMYTTMCIPYWYEGWDDIQIEYSISYKWGIHAVERLIDFEQDNSHHKLTLGQHLKATFAYIDKKFCHNYDDHSMVMRAAALLHDYSKPFVKSFINGRGVETTEAHYYNHQYCSAYDSLFFGLSNALDVAIRIMWHMQPYFWERDNNEKMRNKYKKLWGEELYNDIMLLHSADVASH